MTEREIDWSIPQRQSVAAIFIVMAKSLIEVIKYAWPIVFVILLGTSGEKSNSLELIVLLVPIFPIAASLIDFLFFRYSIQDSELIIKKGLLVRKTIVLPVEKIQSIQIDRTWLHNLFKSAKVSFDSAGSEKLEIEINAIKLEKAEALREYLNISRKQTNIDTNQQIRDEEVIITLATRDLLKLSISSNHLEAFFILLAFALSAIDNIEKVIGKPAKGFWQFVQEFVAGSSFKMVMFLVVAIMFVSIAVSVARVLLLYLDFRITRYSQGFRIKTGLINMKEKLVPLKKIQHISWHANWLRRRMNLYLLQFHIAGADLVREKQQIKVPITQKSYISQILESYHPLLPVNEMIPLRVHSDYVLISVLLKGLLPSLILAGLTFPFFGGNSLWFLLLIPLTLFQSILFKKKFRFWANGDAMQVYRGVYGTEEAVLRWNNIQKVRLRQSAFQRRRNLATVRIQTAGGRIVVPFVKVEEAQAIVNFALYKIERENQPWM